MTIALLLISLTVAVLVGTAVGERLGLPAPLFLTVLGIGASFLPFVPEVHLQPEIVLIGLLPPLLYTAAVQTSLVDFAAQRRPILLLSVALVVVTTVIVGAVVQLCLPDLGWPGALAIGAVVAPPDAVAATAVAKRIGLPRTVVSILEGESLVNDATSLVALRTAIAAMGGGVTVIRVGGDFLLAAGGGVVVGLAVFVVVARIRHVVTQSVMDTAISMVTPFLAYVLAEEIHASGVIAVVVAGLLLGHKAAIIQTAQSRITEILTWRTVAFLLENAVFLLIGLQARWIIEGVGASGVSLTRVVAVCAATLATVIVVRLAWVWSSRLWLWARGGDTHGTPWANVTLVGWAGMRGVVTLAAAFILPIDTPHREVLLLIAFTVVAGTLLLQGLSLPWLTRRLGVTPPDPAEDALARATLLQQAAVAGLARLTELEGGDEHGVREAIRARVDQRTFAAWERLSTTAEVEAPSEAYARLRLAMIKAERTRVLEIRGQGRVPSDVVKDVLAMLDLEESMIDAANHERSSLTNALVATSTDSCAELDAFPALVESDESDEAAGPHGLAPSPEPPVCAACVAAGTTPVALRRCLTCGHVGCCDSSPGTHATDHYERTGHPVMQSAEPGEAWRWCYVHHLTG